MAAGSPPFQRAACPSWWISVDSRRSPPHPRDLSRSAARLHPGQVAGINRNRWPLSSGSGGRFRPDWVAGFGRNAHLESKCRTYKARERASRLLEPVVVRCGVACRTYKARARAFRHELNRTLTGVRWMRRTYKARARAFRPQPCRCTRHSHDRRTYKARARAFRPLLCSTVSDKGCCVAVRALRVTRSRVGSSWAFDLPLFLVGGLRAAAA